MEKNEIRRRVRHLRGMLSEIERMKAAEEVFSRVEKTTAFIMADRILMYHSLPDEVNTRAFLRKWADRKNFYLPRVNGVNLDILPYDESRLELGSFHIEEPTGTDTVDPSEIELIIVPAVAYDRKGNRLGRGKGFYDRRLQSAKATTIGVGYGFQLVDEVPTEPHDQGVDMVITENATIIIRHGSI